MSVAHLKDSPDKQIALIDQPEIDKLRTLFQVDSKIATLNTERESIKGELKRVGNDLKLAREEQMIVLHAIQNNISVGEARESSGATMTEDEG